MSQFAEVTQRLQQLANREQNPLIHKVVAQLESQHYQGVLSAEFVRQYCQDFQLSAVELALACLPLSACYALTPVSHFNVGAIAIGTSGTFYFGANQEFHGEAISQTIHAEQSAISHAWLAGEQRLSDVVVNYTPCGHCRQFMNELNSAGDLNIHLPHCQNQRLHHYLPDAFGPQNLAVEHLLFDEQCQPFVLAGDALTQAAIQAAAHSYAPYSAAFSGVALQCGDDIVCGRYAENAAFNPSLLPLQSALNLLRMGGGQRSTISRIVLAERTAVLSCRASTASFAKQYFDLDLEYVNL